MKAVEAGPDNVYRWGQNCLGWRLLDLPQFQVRQETMPPCTEEEPHVHRHAHQFFYVLDGAMTLRTPDGVERILSGQGLHIAAGTPHWVRNDDDSDLIFLLASSPGTNGDRVATPTEAWAQAGS